MALVQLALGINDAGVKLPYADLQPSTSKAGPWAEWLRILASCNASVRFDGIDLFQAIGMPIYESTMFLWRRAEDLLTYAARYLTDSAWAAWLKIPLIGAASQGDFEAVSLLLRAGAGGPDRSIGTWMIPEGGGRTLLHSAADGGNVKVVEALLEAGAGVAVNTLAGGFSPFHVAVIRGSVPTAMALARAGAAVRLNAPFQQSALHLAAGTGHAEMIADLVVKFPLSIEARDDMGASPLQAAAWHGHARCARVLLNFGAKVDVRDNSARTALFKAARCASGRASGGEGAGGGCGGCEVMRALLGAGAEVRVSSSDGATPLHVACQHGHLDAVRLLLRHDADEGAVCDLGKTPEDEVVHAYNTNYAISHGKAQAILDGLAAAPAGRSWRRRGWLVMLRARSARFNKEHVMMSGEDLGAAGEEVEKEFFDALRGALGVEDTRARGTEIARMEGLPGRGEEDGLLARGGHEGGEAKLSLLPPGPAFTHSSVQAGIFDLSMPYEDAVNAEESPYVLHERTAKAQRTAMWESQAFVRNGGNDGDDRWGVDRAFRDLVFRTFEMTDGPFEIIARYL